MRIGAMNHPARDVEGEIAWIAEMGLDFIDLTLEPPLASSWSADAHAIRAALDRTGLDVVGHTAYYLPIASPIEEIRVAAVAELRRCLEVFAAIGARWMNVHPDAGAPHHDRAHSCGKVVQSIRDLLPHAGRAGMGLMLENLPGGFNDVAGLSPLLDALPEVALHLDIGHANLHAGGSSAQALIAAYGRRIRHVHLHDNLGPGPDLHLPLGTGTVDLAASLRALRGAGYDATITLEVFAPDKNLLAYSRDVLRRAWDASAP